MSELGKIVFSELRFYSPQHPAGDIYYRFEVGLLSKAKFCEIMAEHLEPIIKQWAKLCVHKEEYIKDHHERYYSECPRCCEIVAKNQARKETLKNIEEERDED